MQIVNMFDAKTNLSKLIASLESGEEKIIYIARNGEPIAQMNLIPKKDVSKRIGIAKGKIKLSSSFDAAFDALDAEIENEFEGG